MDGKPRGGVGPGESLVGAEKVLSAQEENLDEMVVTFGDSYAPFAWGTGPKVQGVQVDFVHEILVNRMGLEVRFEGCPWKRCQKWVREGEKDAFFTVPTPMREEYTVKSDIPFYETHFVLHAKRGSPVVDELRQVRSVRDLERLRHLRHIHMFGSGWHENVLRNMENVTTVPNASVIPKMLVLGRADVYIEQKEMFRYQAKISGVSGEVTTLEEPSIMQNEWHLFIGKSSQYSKLAPEITEVLKSLRQNGELEEIRNGIFGKYGI